MVDYESEIQPVFDRSCSGGACHIGSGTSGVDLSDYTVTMASFGDQYGESVVKPFDVASSPLWLKISQDTPQFGSRMPLAQPPLDDAEIDLIGRWIDQGALSAPVPAVRGDVDRNGTLELTDAVVLLQFLFLGGEAPMCDATADADASEVLEVTDVVAILNYLFRGGAPLPELTAEEVARCTGSNEPPIVEPIGTVQGREGLLLEFAVIAHDPRDDVLSYSIESGPERMTIDSSSGVIRWSPRFGEVGDYRIRVRVLDAGVPPLAEDATGLVRVLEGNHPRRWIRSARSTRVKASSSTSSSSPPIPTTTTSFSRRSISPRAALSILRRGDSPGCRSTARPERIRSPCVWRTTARLHAAS